MNLLVLNHEFPPIGGGAGRASYHIASNWVNDGHHVDVITSSYSSYTKKKHVDRINVYYTYGVRRNLLDNIVWISMPIFILQGLWMSYRLSRNVNYEKIYCFFTIPAGVIGVILKYILNTNSRLIVSLRGADVPYHNPDEFRLTVKILSPLVRWIWKNSDEVVALSNGLTVTAKKTLPRYPYRVIYNGVDSRIFSHTSIYLDNEVLQLITVSRLVKRKGIQHLLYAISNLKKLNPTKKFTLKIVGDGNYKEKLMKLSYRLFLHNDVEFLGYIKNDKLSGLYNKSDIFVLPSLTESFGQVFAEAMACGLPIIGTTVGGIPEIVIDEENGLLVAPGDVRQLQNALYVMMNDYQMRLNMSTNNVDRARSVFNWQKTSKLYLDL